MARADVWSRFSADPRDPASASLRATDADRDHALEVLRDSYGDGRLTRPELEVRSADVLATRTLGEIGAHLSDLVAGSTAPAPRPSAAVSLHAEAERAYERDLRDARNGWILVSGICMAVWAVTSVVSGGLLFFWPVFPVLGVGIGYFATVLQRETRVEAHEQELARRRRHRRELE